MDIIKLSIFLRMDNVFSRRIGRKAHCHDKYSFKALLDSNIFNIMAHRRNYYPLWYIPTFHWPQEDAVRGEEAASKEDEEVSYIS